MSNKPKSVVVLSGGQDSTTCFFAAERETDVVGIIHFQYGQQHASPELAMVSKLINRFPHVNSKVVDLSALREVAISNLTRVGADTSRPHALNPNLPASFVPGRNLVMLTLASAYAQGVCATELWTGVCETDYSGYPDCRDKTIKALNVAIVAGLDYDIDIRTPLMFIDKADTFKMAYDLGEMDWIVENTHTCYVGDHDTRNPWGYGCGECPACKVREAGYAEYVKRYDDHNVY